VDGQAVFIHLRETPHDGIHTRVVGKKILEVQLGLRRRDTADGGVAEKRPIAVRGCTDRRERRRGREHDLRINGGAIIESAYQ